jgi:23S rRNA (pseudouridine1915-N3)-methyltransferase
MLIAAIGRLKKKSPEDQLIEEYIRKTRWPVTVRESEEKKALSGDALKEAESRLLLGNVPTGAKVVALDERGEMLSSTELARKIAHWRDAGTQDVAFLIGGANGHAEAVRQRADLVLSFGRMTLPHMLIRVVVAEQIYRIRTILDGHPYHRE